jgi:hypothetical protein
MPLPEELGGLWDSLAGADSSLEDRDCRLSLVDLREVVASQSVVATDDPRVGNLSWPPGMVELARLCLPLRPERPPTAAYDIRNAAWVIRGQRAAMQLVGRYNGPVGDEAPGSQLFGFIVSAQPSRLSLRRVEDRLIIRDGHHRALALLTLGVHFVPALVHDGWSEGDADRGALPMAALLSADPPRMSDYLDLTVSVECDVPWTESVITISAHELQLPD